MSVTSKSRFVFLTGSSLLALMTAAIIVTTLFSVSFRYTVDHQEMKGIRYYGLIRFCFEPENKQNYRSDDSYAHVCHLRKPAPKDATSFEYRTYYGDFELATLILFSCAVACALLAVCFAICTLFTPFGALAHSVLLLGAAISALSGFIVYTYFNELKENQTEREGSSILRFHFGWAYYWSGGAAGCLILSFICGLFASACVLVHKKQQRKMETVVL